QSAIEKKIQNRFINLRRMQGHARRRSLCRGRKGDCPGQTARATVTTTVEQTTNSPKCVPKSNTRREDISPFPERQLASKGIQNVAQRSPDQSTVINQTAMLHHKNFPNRLAGKLFAPIGDDVKRPSTGNRADNEPGTQIENSFGRNPFPQPAPAGGPKPGQKTEGDHHPIPMHREGAKTKSNWMHNLDPESRFDSERKRAPTLSVR